MFLYSNNFLIVGVFEVQDRMNLSAYNSPKKQE